MIVTIGSETRTYVVRRIMSVPFSLLRHRKGCSHIPCTRTGRKEKYTDHRECMKSEQVEKATRPDAQDSNRGQTSVNKLYDVASSAQLQSLLSKCRST